MQKKIIIYALVLLIVGNVRVSAQLSSYMQDKKPFNQIHLYQVGKNFYVSGLNKDIDSLTVEEMALLKKKSKVIEYDISLAKQIRKGEANIIENDSCEVRANLHGTGYANIIVYMQEHLSKKKFDGFNTTVVFIIETDGSLTCPIVLSGRNVEENKEVIRVLRKSSKNWNPAKKNDKKVRSMQGYNFSFVLKTYTVREHFRF